jgi:8-amino-7-oxononanoate synthase
VITALADRDTVIFSDELNHASLIDGCRLSRGQVVVYRHGDVRQLEESLREHSTACRRLIVTDTVFSMDGDVAPLPELIDLVERHDCLLVLDEAHATGVLGEAGRGLYSHAQYPNSERVIKIGTLSKALGAQGGFVCGSKQLIRWLVNRARPYLFSTALAPPAAAAAHQAVKIVQDEPEARDQLQRLSARLRAELQSHGYGQSSRCQIVPVMIGPAREAVELSRRLEAEGLLVPAIRPPSVPEGTARLRISLTAAHSDADVEQLLAGLGKASGLRIG